MTALCDFVICDTGILSYWSGQNFLKRKIKAGLNNAVRDIVAKPQEASDSRHVGALPSGDEGRLRCLNEKRFLPNLHKTFKCTYTTANSFMCHKILLCGSNFVTAVKNKPKKSSLVLCVTKKYFASIDQLCYCRGVQRGLYARDPHQEQ